MDARVRQRRLPHWDVPGATYFITSCLAGSLSAQGLLDLEQYRRNLETRVKPRALTDKEWVYQREKMIYGRIDSWLDLSPGTRHLEDPQLAQICANAMLHFADERYTLLAFVVMPSHFHWVFRPLETWIVSLGPTIEERPPRERVMHSLKTFTAWECNRMMKKRGPFWQDESYEQCIRADDELHRIIDYVEQNPVKAKLVPSAQDWPYSSAVIRERNGIASGEAIPKGMR